MRGLLRDVRVRRARNLSDALADALRGQRLLLVPDNCEHLLAETGLVGESI